MNKKTKGNAKRLEKLMSPVMRLMHRFSAQLSKCEDFTIAQHRALMMVFNAGTMTIKQFQENLSIAQSTASETVERLVQLGWLEKGKDLKDRRITIFSLTKNADRMLNEKKAERIKIMEKIMEPLTEKEQRKFLEGFELLLAKHQERQPNSNRKGLHENQRE
jgi:DNA-binding MarR family transcriptional regulator